MSYQSEPIPCTFCNEYLATDPIDLTNHQRLKNCINKFLENANDTPSIGSTPEQDPMDLDGPTIDYEDDEPMVSQSSPMSTASMEGSSAVSYTSMDYPNYVTGESSTQRPNDSTIRL